jgi:disulfide bond formation protein DsbB
MAGDPARAESASRHAYGLGGLAMLGSLGVIATALGFEHLGGYVPCPLCLQQRYAYYFAIPVLFAAMALTSEKPRFAAFLFFGVALAFLANAGLGVYHSGVEWKFWPGPETCGTVQAMPTTAGDLLKQLEETRVVRCDEAAWRLFGLSFAGWNVVTSIALMAISLKAAFETPNKA